MPPVVSLHSLSLGAGVRIMLPSFLLASSKSLKAQFPQQRKLRFRERQSRWKPWLRVERWDRDKNSILLALHPLAWCQPSFPLSSRKRKRNVHLFSCLPYHLEIGGTELVFWDFLGARWRHKPVIDRGQGAWRFLEDLHSRAGTAGNTALIEVLISFCVPRILSSPHNRQVP